MENETLQAISNLMEAAASDGKSAGAIAVASLELVESLTKGKTTRPQDVFTGIPDADQALAQAAGVAEIAGRYHVSTEDVLAFTKLLLGLGLAFVA